jgi:Cu-Zn family superoxide dismutase
MTIGTIRSAVLGVAVSLAAVGCCENKDHKTTAAGHDSHVLLAADLGAADIKDAVAVINGTTGNDAVKGWVKFSDAGAGGVKVVAHVEGLAPNSEHGFHIHEFGDATDMAKAMSAGRAL